MMKYKNFIASKTIFCSFCIIIWICCSIGILLPQRKYLTSQQIMTTLWSSFVFMNFNSKFLQCCISILTPLFSKLEFFISFAFHNSMCKPPCRLDMIQPPKTNFPSLSKNHLYTLSWFTNNSTSSSLSQILTLDSFSLRDKFFKSLMSKSSGALRFLCEVLRSTSIGTLPTLDR